MFRLQRASKKYPVVHRMPRRQVSPNWAGRTPRPTKRRAQKTRWPGGVDLLYHGTFLGGFFVVFLGVYNVNVKLYKSSKRNNNKAQKKSYMYIKRNKYKLRVKASFRDHTLVSFPRPVYFRLR